MPTYAELTDNQKAIVDEVAKRIRAANGERAQAWNAVKAIADDTAAVNLIMSIDAAGIIPNKSGLAAAHDVTRAELVAGYTLINNDRTTNDTAQNRAAMSKLAGINAMLG